MANLTVTPREIRPLDSATTRLMKMTEAAQVGAGVIVNGTDNSMSTCENWNATSAAGVMGALGLIVSGSRHAADGSVIAGEVVTVVLLGQVYLGPAAVMDVTKPYYAAATDGLIADTAPAHARCIGYPLTTDTIWFNPASAAVS